MEWCGICDIFGAGFESVLWLFPGLSMRETPEVHVPNHRFCSASVTPAVLCRKNKQVTDC